MPYACLLFNENINTAMRSAADSIAAGSAFEAHPLFHVPIIGSLHRYTADKVANACDYVANDAPLSFNFGKWEISGSQLRATIECEAAAQLATRLQGQLPAGRPWTMHYVVIGSVAAIEAARRDEFLAAVSASFPNDPQQHHLFAKRLEYSEHISLLSKKPCVTATQNRSAARRAAKPSTHRKWSRVGKASHVGPALVPMDTSTGQTGQAGAHRSAGIVKSGHKKANGIAKAPRQGAGPLARR
jgi:hypothetical protein